MRLTRSSAALGRMQRSRRRGWTLVPVLALTGLTGVARGSIPEDPNLEQWTARYNGPVNDFHDAQSVAVAPDGSKVFVTGGSYDYGTVAYSTATGAQLWVARYNGGSARSIAVVPDGSKVFVTGTSGGDYATVAYSTATGAQLWAARYNGPVNYSDIATSIAVAPDGSKVFVTGNSVGSGDNADYATVAYSTATGAELWTGRYNGPTNFSDGASSLAVAPDGSKVFVTGTSWNLDCYCNYNYATVAYSTATGAQIWVARYTGPRSRDGASSLAVAPDGSMVFVTGSSLRVGDDYDYATVAYSTATGAQLWVARSEPVVNLGGLGNAAAHSLAVAPDGSKVFVTGTSYGSSEYDYATVGYSAATGAALWVARYNGPNRPLVSNDRASSLAVAPDGSKVFVTGYSSGSGLVSDMGCDICVDQFSDYATVAYSAASGAELWVARYNGPGDSYDGAYSIAVAPDGSNVFVTGTSVRFGPGEYDYTYDYATVAYRATSCANGKDGPVSGQAHQVYPLVAPAAAPYVHGVNCDAVAGNGL